MSEALWGGRPGKRLLRWTAGRDRELDRRLARWDLLGSIAHVRGLVLSGVLDRADGARLLGGLRELLHRVEEGLELPGPLDEDVHSAVERLLVERLGEAGRRVHAGRSRNDQVDVDLRLHARDRLAVAMEAILAAARALLRFARRHRGVAWPGYTHLRPAMPSSPALWAAGLAEAFLDDLEPPWAILRIVDRCPLGSAAGYGTPLPLPREDVARWLGFDGPVAVVTTVQLSRARLAASALQALWPAMRDAAVLAADVVLRSSPEFGHLVIPGDLATGSSIMPGKRNPDVFELVRARAAAFEGRITAAAAVGRGLTSGYHRDLQVTKEPLLHGLEETIELFETLAWAVPLLRVDRERCEAALRGGVLAADEAFRRVREGMPFRDAYREVAGTSREVTSTVPPADLLAVRDRPGEAGDPVHPVLPRRADRWARRLRTRRRRWERALAELVRDTLPP